MKKQRSFRTRLILTTSGFLLSFLIIFTALVFMMLAYYGNIMEQIYDIDEDILTPVVSILGVAFLILILVALLASFLGGYMISSRLLKTITNFIDDIKRIRDEGLDNRMIITTSDEFGQLALEFNQMMDEIQVAMNAQTQFVGDATHELKTPLSILKSNLEMLERWGKDDPKVLAKAIETCSIETNRMIVLVQELLDLTRTKKAIHDIEAFDPRDEITRIVESFEQLYPEESFHVVFKDVNPIQMEKMHFEQLLVIFLDNAVKYRKKDSKQVDIEFIGSILKIRDDGVGIKPQNIDAIFDRFFREDESRKYENHSYGLGLSIAKQLSEVYNFSIRVESEKHRYSEFIIEFH